MYIQNLKLKNFRNYKTLNINFSKNINIFLGNNAQGKTNILESIYISAIGKSFRAKKESELINLNCDDAYIEVNCKKENIEKKIKIIFNKKNKKIVYVNGIKLNKLSELIGTLNIVLFSPDNIDILKGGPANRRRFLNIIISQIKPIYIYYINSYNAILEQRNNYLRQIKSENKKEDMLEIWDLKLAEYAYKVYKYRYEMIKKISQKIPSIHSKLTNNTEKISIKYISDCENYENYLNELKINRKNDIMKGYTTKGIHKDDFSIKINDKEVNIYGSQGQNRTAILSLKLAELEIINDENGEYPILLLDDFMSELDSTRRINFFESIKNAQVFITGTDILEIKDLSKEINKEIFYVSKGEIIERE